MNASAHSAFVERLTEIISHFPSRAALAKAARLSAAAMQSYMAGSEPTRPALVSLARAANVSLEWLADGRGYKESRPQIPEGYAAIPFFNVRASKGYVYPLFSAENAEFWYLKLDWLAYPGLQPSKLLIVEATDSLVPEIRERDVLVVDQRWMTKFVGTMPNIPTGLYLISQRARLCVRQILGVAADVVQLARSGGKGGKEPLRMGQDGFTVHGRIIWYGHALPIPHIVQSSDSVGRRRPT